MISGDRGGSEIICLGFGCQVEVCYSPLKSSLLILLFHADHNPALLSQLGSMYTRHRRTAGEVGRKWAREGERGRERAFCPPGMTESLMQKDPTWREGGDVCVVGSVKELLASCLRSPSPSLKTHLSSFLPAHTPFSSCINSPSRSSKRDSGLFRAEDVSSCYWRHGASGPFQPSDMSAVTTAERARPCTRHFRLLPSSHGCMH